MTQMRGERLRILQANKFWFLNGGSEVVMFKEREFLGGFADLIDFSMNDERNLPSDYAASFVSNREYDRVEGPAAKVSAALNMVHSSEAVRKIGALIDETRPDIVHCHNIYHQLTPSIIGAAKQRGVPVVLTLHDYKPVCPIYTRLRHGEPCSDCLGGDFTPVLRHRCAGGSMAKSALLYAEAAVQQRLRNYEKVDRVIAPSRFMKDSVAQRFADDRVAVIPNGVSLGPEPDYSNEGYVLYFGRLSSEKGVQTLLAASRLFSHNWPVRIVGTGPLEQPLRAGYPYARFDGYLAGEALRRALAGAAVVVVPSEWYENCPMSVLEAMALGKPVLASDIGGIPEIVADGVSGRLFPAGDQKALAALIDLLMYNPALRTAFGKSGRALVESRFSDDRHNAALLDLYRSL